MGKETSVREAEEVIRRGAIYGSLARAFGPVELYLKDGRALRELRTLISQGSELTSAHLELPDAENVEAPELDNLAAERLRLFEKGDCPPYEGSYRSEEDPLKDAIMADIAGFYRAFGLEPRNELPDHLVSELEFMGLLCLKESRAMLGPDHEAAEIARDAQRKFLRDHLGRWVERFQAAIRMKSRVSLYPRLADILVDFIESEMDLLGVSVEGNAIPPGG